MSAITIEIIFKKFDEIKKTKGNDVALKFVKDCLNERDDTAAVSFMLRNLGDVINAETK